MQSNCYSLKNFTSIDEKILYICANEYTDFFKKPNVVGMGLGYRVSNGFRTREKCLTVLVSRKIPPCNLSSTELIPKYYKGIKIDIHETGFFHQNLLTSRVRPTLGGYSISSTTYKQNGSIGCVVIDASSNYFILSCNHTIAGLNTVQIGTDIIQPSILDNGNPSKDLVGSLYKFAPLLFNGDTNYVDAALALTPNRSFISSNIYMLGKPQHPIAPNLDLSVRKAGRTSDITYGYVVTIGVTIPINSPRGRIIYKDQILATKMSSPGDSGSLLMDLNNHSVGLIMGASATTTVANPIKYVLNTFNVKIAP